MRLTCTEAEFQKQVIALAKLRGWRCAHFRPALTARGRWVTAVQGQGAGFPDLVLIRRGVIIAAELKSETGRLSQGQREWLESFEDAGVQTFVWRPADWKAIERVLEGEE